jgi:hypothetical protein
MEVGAPIYRDLPEHYVEGMRQKKTSPYSFTSLVSWEGVCYERKDGKSLTQG